MRTPPFEEPENPCYKCGGEGVFPYQFDNEIIWECLDCKITHEKCNDIVMKHLFLDVAESIIKGER